LIPEDVRDLALRLLRSLPAGDRLCHGDFHIGNVMVSSSDPVILDWGYASKGDPVGDVAQSVLLHRIGAMPPGSSALFALLAKAGRRMLTGRYLSVYRRIHSLEQGRFDRWLFVHAAARLGEPVEDEHPALLRFIERARPSLP
jgi:aminoglycoside phosphotransferase (APT) family kinase protein